MKMCRTFRFRDTAPTTFLTVCDDEKSESGVSALAIHHVFSVECVTPFSSLTEVNPSNTLDDEALETHTSSSSVDAVTKSK